MFKRTFVAVLAVLTVSLLQACGGNDNNSNDPPPPVAKQQLDSVAPQQWNGIAVQALHNFYSTDPMGGYPPFEESRLFAMAFTAAHDALNAIDPRYKPYLTDTSVPNANPDAAVAAAMHDVLNATIPGQTSYLDGAYAAALAAIPAGDAKTAGIALGQKTAKAIIDARTGDGAGHAQGPYAAPMTPGVYQPTPPVGFAAYVHWGAVKPFAVADVAAYRPPPPFKLTDLAYSQDFIEVKAFGSATSSVRSADQSQAALFWLENTPQSFERISASIAKAKNMNGWDQARMYALVALAEADAYTSVEAAKYVYTFWRPITAIHAADSDGNPDTVADPNWMPDAGTPPDPDYPSGHSGAAGAGEVVLQNVLGGDAVNVSYSSSSLPSATRSYTSLSQIASEIAASRIYVGYHFRNSTVQGRKLGQAIGDFVVKNKLQPR